MTVTRGLPIVSLVPADGWWFAIWYGDSDNPWISVDVCIPAVLMDGEWTYVDLELDPHRSSDSRVWIDDEDEFAEACRAGTIYPDEQAAARQAADEIAHRLGRLDGPFGTTGWQWLRRGMTLPLPPLTDLT